MNVAFERRALGRTLARIAAWTLPPLTLLPVVLILGPGYGFHDWQHYLGLHSLMEAFACGVSVLIFGMGWHAAAEERSARMAILSAGFLAVGLLDLLHLLSYPGMPTLVTPASPGKAIDFWLAARYAQGVTLLAGCLFPPPAEITVSGRLGVVAAALGFTALASWIGLFHPGWLPVTYQQGLGQTDVKIALEIGVMALDVATIAVLASCQRSGPDLPVPLMVSALLLLLASEVTIGLYRYVYDNFNVLAHVYKVLGFLLIYRAIFVSGVRGPYRRLAASERDYRQLLRQAAIAALRTDDTGRIVLANELAEAVTGRSVAALRGMAPSALFAAPAIARPAAEESGPRVLETELLRPDGARVLVEMRDSPQDGGGRIILLRDIAAYRQADAERRIRDIAFASSVTPIVMVNLDQTIRYANGAFVALWGYDGAADVLGQPLAAMLQRPDQAAVLAETLLTDGRWNGELRGVCRDGGAITVRVAANMVRDEAGEPVCIIASFADLTAWNRMDAERRRWADAFQNAVVGLGVTDAATGRKLSVNPAYATMHRMSVAELTGYPVSRLYPREQRATQRAAVAVADLRGHTEFDTVRLRADGERFPARVWLRTIFDAAGRPEYRIATVIDLSERQTLEEHLRQAQKMEAIGNLTGGLAHDFNNLLGVIVLSLDSLLPDLAHDREASALGEEALAAALKGAELTRQLLAFARRQALQPTRIDVNSVVREIMALARRTLGEAIVIRLDLAEDVWPVFADRGQLEASLLNLAVNARDAMPDGGELTVSTANAPVDAAMAMTHPELVEGAYATIAISDTGLGMTPEVRARIFEPFFTTKAPGRGTGLGLSAVFGFLRQSKGLVTVYSEVGHGTTFRLYLPRSAADAPVAAPERPAPPPVPNHGDLVLVVEDNALFRAALVHQVRALGYQVAEAPDARSALERLDDPAIRLVLSDVVMAGHMDGIALARDVVARWPLLPVVLMSGFAEQRINGNGELPASVYFLKKPFRSDELARTLREALSGY